MSLKWIRKIQYGGKATEITLPAAVARHFKEQDVKDVTIEFNEEQLIITPAK